MILSALLSLAMLFASCSSGANNETEESTVNSEANSETVTDAVTEKETEEPTEAPEQIPADEVVDYGPIIDKWNEYVNFNAPAASTGLQASQLFSTGVTDNTSYGGSKVTKTAFFAGKLVLHTTVTEYLRPHPAGGEKPATAKAYKIYSMETGEVVLEMNVAYFNDDVLMANEYKIEFLKNSTDFNATDLGIFKVTYSEYDPNKVENNVPAPGYKHTYTYYDTKGTVLYTGSTDADFEVLYLDNVDTVRLNGKLYACANGEIVYTYEEGESFRVLACLPTQYKDYGYYFENGTVQVADSKYRMVVDYLINEDVTDRKVVILSDGNVLVSGVIAVPADSEIADYVENNVGYEVVNIVIDVKTGEVTKVDTGFVIESIITNATPEKGISLKNEAHQYAEIVRFADGRLAPENESVILDGKLAEVAVLPDFVENQIGVEDVVRNGNLIIKANNLRDTIYYSIDVNRNEAKTVNLYADVENVNNLSGGFEKDGVIYSDYLNKLKDVYVDYDHIAFTNDGIMLLYSSYYDELGGVTVNQTGVAYITEYGTVSVNTIANTHIDLSGADPFAGRGYYVGANGVYNVYGTQIISVYDGQTVTVRQGANSCSYAIVTNANGELGYYIIK